VKPAPFAYHAPASLEEALTLFARHGGEAKVLAGGQSLVPLMNFRLARPAHVVDLNRLRTLAGIREADGMLCLGAMTRQRAIERSPVVRRLCPLLAEATALIGHPAIRSRGTIGGSLAHADPAAEYPAVLAALEGTVVARSLGGERTLTADSLFVGYLTTSLEPDEVLVEVRLPLPPRRHGWAFEEVSRRHGDFALVAVAALVAVEDGRCARVRLAAGGVGPAPQRLRPAELALEGRAPGEAEIRETASLAAADVTPESDLHASAEFRRHLAGVLTARALRRAVRLALEGAP